MGNEHSTSTSPTRRGPRGGVGDVKAQILTAARACFSEDGYQATTIKAIAAKAGVDTKLVHYYFGAKRELFATLMGHAFTDFGLMEELVAAAQTNKSVGTHYVRRTLTLLETTPEGQLFIGLVRSLGTHDESRAIMQAFASEMVERIAGNVPQSSFHIRGPLVGSQMLGLIVMRYILKPPVFADASIDELAEIVGPTIDRYLSS